VNPSSCCPSRWNCFLCCQWSPPCTKHVSAAAAAGLLLVSTRWCCEVLAGADCRQCRQPVQLYCWPCWPGNVLGDVLLVTLVTWNAALQEAKSDQASAARMALFKPRGSAAAAARPRADVHLKVKTPSGYIQVGLTPAGWLMQQQRSALLLPLLLAFWLPIAASVCCWQPCWSHQLQLNALPFTSSLL